MYSSGYSQVSKHSPQAQKRMQYRSKGKSCGYYMRIVFFFSSLIQSLIIVSLVLFLVYGKNQDSASTARIQDLEESFSRLSIENVGLRQQRKNLTTLLNATLTEKARNDWDLVKIRHLINISVVMIQDLEKRHQQCNTEMMMYRISGQGCKVLMPTPDTCNCGMLVERMKARLDLVESNFTQTIKTMRVEVEQTARERDYINLEAIRLRRDKSTQEKELQFYKQRCKEDFSQSLSGVSNVSKAFLLKIESLFPTHIAFQLTCPKQREHLEQIRANCTNLSREVEDKLQRYLNTVGEQVSEIQAENSRFKAENWRLSEDYRWCTQNRSGLIQEHKQNFEKLQRKHDQDKEKLLMEKMRLIGEKEVLEQSVRYKSKEVDHLTVQVKHLNMSCVRKPQFGGSTTQLGTSSQSGWNWSNGGGSSSATSSSTGRVGGLGSSFGSSGTQFNKLGSTGTGSSSSSFGSIPSLGSSGTGFNKLGSTGTGSSSSSFGSSSSLGSSGTGFNKLGSTGTGSSSSSFGSSSSLGSSSTGFNKLGSTGTGSSSSSFGSSSSLGSSSTGFNKLGSTGTGSSSSSFSSLGSNPSLSSSGIGLNKPALGARGSSTIGSSSGSLGSSSSLGSSGIGANKPTSNAKSSQVFGSWFGTGNSNSGQSKPGSGTGKVLSSGSSYGGTGSSLGRTNGVGGGSVNVAQHLQELQRIINPSSPQDKQDLSRMLG